MSVFNVGVATFSWNTTILLEVGALPAVNAFDTTVVAVVAAGKSANINVYPSPPACGAPAGEPHPLLPACKFPALFC